MIMVWTKELRAQYAERARARFSGVPKTEQQKSRMRDAKLGKPKSKSHKEAMRQAHLFRGQKIREIIEEMGCSCKEAQIEYQRRKKAGEYIDKQ